MNQGQVGQSCPGISQGKEYSEATASELKAQLAMIYHPHLFLLALFTSASFHHTGT